MLNFKKTLILSIFATLSLQATPTTSQQAKQVVQNWRVQHSQPLDTNLAFDIAGVDTKYEDGNALYHIVSMRGSGFVVVSGDDTVEPIIAIVPDGKYDENADDFLNAMLKNELSVRVKNARAKTKPSRSSSIDGSSTPTPQEVQTQKAKAKWTKFETTTSTARRAESLSSLDDVRVPPMTKAQWGQANEGGGQKTYNLFTPENRLAGCAATAFAQVLYHFKHTSVLPTKSFSYRFSGRARSATLMGGNGQGSPYEWDKMVDGYNVPLLSSREAMGRLLHDAGIVINSHYMTYVTGGTIGDLTADAFVNVFGFSNAKYALYGNSLNTPVAFRDNIFIPNLEAGIPMPISLGAHAVDCDGYGYNSGTRYFHLNMGYRGSSNIWYDLPNVTTNYNIVEAIVYNMFTTGTGEIISGRVVNHNGQAIEGVSMKAQRVGGTSYSATTNSRGIYAFKAIPSNSTYEITATKSGMSFGSQTIDILESISGRGRDMKIGNRWGINFKDGVTTNTLPLAEAREDRRVVETHNITISGQGTDEDGNIESYQWLEGSTILSSTHTFQYSSPVVGNHTLILRVTDNNGGVGEDTMIVDVTKNQAPVMNAKEDITMATGKRLIRTAKFTDDADAISGMGFKWYLNSVRLTVSSGLTIFIQENKMPPVGQHVLLFKGTDSGGLSAYDTFKLTITDPNVSNTPPSVEAGATKTLKLGESITINGSASDSDGIQSYKWAFEDSILSTSPSFTYTPTKVGRFVLVLHAYDTKGMIGGDSVVVNVTQDTTPVPNNPPVANAGIDKSVKVNTDILITGSGSDLDGTIASYRWTKGSTTLSDENSFTYSSSTIGTEVLMLTVTDDDGATHSDSMTLHVTENAPTPQPDKANITPIILYLLN